MAPSLEAVRQDRESGKIQNCPTCASPRKENRWFYGNPSTRCEDYSFHTKRKAPKRPMPRADWYVAYLLSIMAGACFFDGARVGGGFCLGFSIILVVLEDGFGVRL